MRNRFGIALLVMAGLGVVRLSAAQLVVRTTDSKGEEMPARIHLVDKHQRPSLETSEGHPSFRNHVSSDGTATFDLKPGEYSLTVERGPEFSSESLPLKIGSENRLVIMSLARIANMASEGWWSGEMHIHRPIEEARLLMRAEDLHFGQFLSWWNAKDHWNGKVLPDETTIQFDGNRAAHLMGGEDERDGGALLFFNLKQPLDITSGQRHYPSSLVYARQVKKAGGWIDIEKPFWWDVPMWIAHGIGDSIGIANNHHHRHGMYENEAWGRPRDEKRLPPPLGNGWWTQEIYHHLLNCGIRIPPSAGSASGVLPNPVGYNRAYVHIDGEPSMEKWFEGLKAGRVFVSNGPLLRVTANQKLPGHVFRTDEETLFLNLNAQVDGNDPIDRMEVVHNGVVKPFPFPNHLVIQESGWFLVRAITTKTNTLRYASTGPFYVELAGQKRAPQQRDSARFFQQWCDERIERLEGNKTLSQAQKTEVIQPWKKAMAFWKQKEREAIPMRKLTGVVKDADTGEPIPARIYLKGPQGGSHFVQSVASEGSAVRYEKRNWINRNSEEFHTTVSAHPFEVLLRPARYEMIVERGKEYVPQTNVVHITDQPLNIEVKLKRWINMAERGWYSGDTHVHRTLTDLPNVMMAEDLNVAFPLTYWVTHAFRPPTSGDKTSRSIVPEGLIKVDDTHVIWPRNTEWEIFSINGKRHTLGAVFALGHAKPFELGVPTVKNVAEEAKRQGALLDLDKHDWPWTMTLPPNMGVHLYELSNNHIWRTHFAFTNWNSLPPVSLPMPERVKAGNERQWIHYTMANYYALLNCGVRMVPTAGTASGVHPVPLGFGRVYVRQPDGFSYEGWKKGLKAGRSFVTTGPMLFATANGEHPGETFEADETLSAKLKGEVVSESPLTSVEVVQDGKVVRTIDGQSERTTSGAYRTVFDLSLPFKQTGWVTVRCWEERESDRVRYAHTAPWHVVIGGKPIKAPKADRDYLVDRVKVEIERSTGVLPEEAISEYREALEYYESRPVR